MKKLNQNPFEAKRGETDQKMVYKVLMAIIPPISAFTASFFLLDFLGLQSTESKILIGGGVLILWELSKARFLRPAIMDYYRGYLNTTAIIMVVFFMAGSIYSSFEGTKIAKLSQEKPQLENALIEKYGADLALLESQAESLRNTTWKGRITRQANKNLEVILPQIAQLKADIRAERGRGEAKLENKSVLMGYLTIILELLLIVSYWNYYKLCYQDFKPQKRLKPVQNTPRVKQYTDRLKKAQERFKSRYGVEPKDTIDETIENLENLGFDVTANDKRLIIRPLFNNLAKLDQWV